MISIHALREEGDQVRQKNRHLMKISIHALREEGDVFPEDTARDIEIFLSTPSARRATPPLVPPLWGDHKFLSTPSARRATSFTNAIYTK